MIVQPLRRTPGAIVGGNFSDPTNERLIYLSAVGLVVLGVLLLVGTTLWWRHGRQEHPALAPLEVMGERAWTKGTEGDRRRRLDRVRIAGAGAATNDSTRFEHVDLEALVRNVPQAFDDLREPDASVEPVEDGGADDADSYQLPEAAEAAAELSSAADDASVDATSVEAERPSDPSP